MCGTWPTKIQITLTHVENTKQTISQQSTTPGSRGFSVAAYDSRMKICDLGDMYAGYCIRAGKQATEWKI